MLPKLPPIPLPELVVNQLDLGLQALELLRDIQHIVNQEYYGEGYRLPPEMNVQIARLIELSDTVY